MLVTLSVQLLIALVTLSAIEVVLRLLDLRYLREGHRPGYTTVHTYDRELGWVPVAFSATKFVGTTISITSTPNRRFPIATTTASWKS